MARQPLGKGLSALLSSRRGPGQILHELPVAAIAPSRMQPRRKFDAKGLEELSASIKEKGVATPIIVRRRGDGFELIAGERRWRATRQAGLKTIPAIVREATDRESLELALIENLQREDLNPMEEAAGYQLLLKDGSTQEELARQLGKDRATISNAIRLLKLPDEIQKAVGEEQITPGHARAILQMDTPAAQLHLFRRIIRGQLSVRQAEMVAKRSARQNAPRAPKGAAQQALTEELSRSLGTKVRLRRRGNRGAIVIEFYSEEELERLIGLLSRS